MLSLCLEYPLPSLYLTIFDFQAQLSRLLLLEAFSNLSVGLLIPSARRPQRFFLLYALDFSSLAP